MKTLLPILFFTSTIVLADDAPVKTVVQVIDTVVNAKPIERVPPKYPMSAARNGQEGWVKLSFVIDNEGNVLDPIVEDSSGVGSLEKAARRSLKKWKYEPAMRDGKAIEQCEMSVQLDFKLSNTNKGVRRQFFRGYNAISDALENKDFPLAESELTKLSDKKMWNMAESAWFWNIDASYAYVVDDAERQRKSISRALSSDISILGESNYISLLSRLFLLEAQSGLLVDALETFERLTAIENSQEVVSELAPYATQIRETLEGEGPLVVKADISEKGAWSHTLSRNNFSFAEIEGNLDEVEIRCKNKRTRTTVASDSEWKIPASWGQCTVFVKGDESSKFKLIELANKA